MTGVDLAGKLETCIANLSALTHRNKGLGDQAKDNIRAVVERGTFVIATGELVIDCGGGLTFSGAALSDLQHHALLGIETIGVEIENPFGHDFNDLPLDTICQTIETNLFELLARRVKSLAESANDRSVLSARADEAYATLATDGSSTSISGGGAVVAIGALTKAVITVLEGVALRESEVRGLLLRAEREADAECLARMSDTSGADSKVEMGGGAADLLSVCQMVAREKAA